MSLPIRPSSPAPSYAPAGRGKEFNAVYFVTANSKVGVFSPLAIRPQFFSDHVDWGQGNGRLTRVDILKYEVKGEVSKLLPKTIILTTKEGIITLEFIDKDKFIEKSSYIGNVAAIIKPYRPTKYQKKPLTTEVIEKLFTTEDIQKILLKV